MRVLILGADGYIGWPLTLHLLEKGYEVAGFDNFSRRKRVHDVESDSLTPILGVEDRKSILRGYKNYINENAHFDLHGDYFLISGFLGFIKPDAIVHLAEQPSAPWSMMDTDHSTITQKENVLGTLNLLWAMREHCPDAHLVKLGTMGEYGTPECDIPEGEIPKKCIGTYSGINNTKVMGHVECPMSSLPFPRSPGSFYHLSKVHDTHNIILACKNWGLRSTDIMQGVVFGLNTYDPGEERLLTRFDYDECFGTVINRFCAQAIIGHPLTIYGEGNQTRGFLTLRDSLQCLTIAIENPPVPGEYRTFNQFESLHTVNSLASKVLKQGDILGLKTYALHIPNPRKESESHYYNPTYQKLFNLGYIPTTDMDTEIRDLMKTLLPYKDRVIENVIMPKIKWN